jgi:hypothetical protein
MVTCTCLLRGGDLGSGLELVTRSIPLKLHQPIAIGKDSACPGDTRMHRRQEIMQRHKAKATAKIRPCIATLPI